MSTSDQETLKIHGNQRVAFAGKTGSGKTFLAQYLLRSFSRLLVVDPKMSLGIPKWNLLEPERKIVKELEKGGSGRLRFYDPPAVNKDGEPVWDSIFELAWQLGDVTVYIDEMYGAVPNGHMSYPLRRLYTQGRERGIGVWSSTQRPSFVPLEMFSEAEWDFIFMLRMEEDRKRIAKATGAVEILDPIRDEHGFYIYNQLWTGAIYKAEFEPPGKRYKTKWDIEQEIARPKLPDLVRS